MSTLWNTPVKIDVMQAGGTSWEVLFAFLRCAVMPVHSEVYVASTLKSCAHM